MNYPDKDCRKNKPTSEIVLNDFCKNCPLYEVCKKAIKQKKET